MSSARRLGLRRFDAQRDRATDDTVQGANRLIATSGDIEAGAGRRKRHRTRGRETAARTHRRCADVDQRAAGIAVGSRQRRR